MKSQLHPALRRLISAPELADPDEARVASAIHTIGLYLGGAASIWTVLVPFVTPDPWHGITLTLVAVSLIVCSMTLARRGRPREGAIVLVGMVWAPGADVPEL